MITYRKNDESSLLCVLNSGVGISEDKSLKRSSPICNGFAFLKNWEHDPHFTLSTFAKTGSLHFLWFIVLKYMFIIIL